MRQRVLFMISSMRGGGSEQQTLLLLRHLNRSQFEPHLYLTERGGSLLPLVPDDVVIHGYGEENRKPGFYFPGRALREQTMWLRELLVRQSIDVVYDRTFHMTLIAGRACEQVSVPRVSTIVSPPQLAVPLVESRFIAQKRRRLSIAYRQSRTVVAVSSAVAESAKRYYGLAGDNMRVLHNGVDLDTIRTLAHSQQVSRDDRLTIVCVGRMTAEKGHRDLIDAVAECERTWPGDSPAIRLWMIGDGPLRVDLEHRACQVCDRHAIEFLGHLCNPAPHIAAADVLVLPSRFEGLPNVVLEAMAIETPVIATSAGGTVELQRDEPTILWSNPNDPLSLAAALLTFNRDREAAKERASAALRLVQTHHDVTEVTRQIEDLLRSGDP